VVAIENYSSSSHIFPPFIFDGSRKGRAEAIQDFLDRDATDQFITIDWLLKKYKQGSNRLSVEDILGVMCGELVKLESRYDTFQD
jgi:hypothetical protein